MNLIKLFKFVVTLMVSALFILVLKSCKKVDSNNIDEKTEAVIKAQKELIQKAIKAKYGDISAGFVYNINKIADDLSYRDKNGKMISINNTNRLDGPHKNGAGCMYDCNTASSVSDLTQIYTLTSVQRFYKCETSTNPALKKSTVVVSWTISVPYGLQTGSMTTPPPPADNGSLTFTPTSGSPIVYNNITPIFDVVPVPNPDPHCATNQIYKVYYIIDDIPNSYFTSTTVVSAALGLNNDCSLTGYYVYTGDVSAPAISQTANLPCNRVDKVYINTLSGPSSCTSAASNPNICSYPTGITSPDEQQVEYRPVNVTWGVLDIWGQYKWDDQTSTVYWGQNSSLVDVPTMPISGGILNLINMVPSTGTWLVRYRNVKTSTCGTINPTGPKNGNWGDPSLWMSEQIIP